MKAKFETSRPKYQSAPSLTWHLAGLPVRREHGTAVDRNEHRARSLSTQGAMNRQAGFEPALPRRRIGGFGYLLAISVLVLGCRREPIDEDPERLVREFILRMQRVHGDPKNARAVFELLWSPAQKNLTERASRSSALAGRKVAPEEMLAPSHFTLRFEPKRVSVNATGNQAVVTVQGDPPLRETREIRCVREDGRWRVVLDLPVLPPIQKRPDTVKDE